MAPPQRGCAKRLSRELADFFAAAPPFVPAVHVNERDLCEWFFLIEGPPDSPYAEGLYIGKLRFPVDYPFNPPSILMLTPTGRFEVNKRLCLSMSDFHPETWSPGWSVGTVLVGLLSFMLEETTTTGAIETTADEKRALAANSRAWNVASPSLSKIFAELMLSAEPNLAKNRAGDGVATPAADAAPAVDAANANPADTAAANATSGAAREPDALPVDGPAERDRPPPAALDPHPAAPPAAAAAPAMPAVPPPAVGHRPAAEALSDGLCAVGEAYLTRGDPHSAIASLLAARDQWDAAPGGERVAAVVSRAQATLGLFAAAADTLRSHPGIGAAGHAEIERITRAEAALAAGNALFRAQRPREALAAYDGAYGPGSAVLSLNRAVAHLALGDASAAAEHATEALRLNGLYDKAKAVLEKAQGRGRVAGVRDSGSAIEAQCMHVG